jgi:inner membrane protein
MCCTRSRSVSIRESLNVLSANSRFLSPSFVLTMSSVFAHTLTGVSIGLLRKPFVRPTPNLYWLMWLAIATNAPDIDYFIVNLHSHSHNGLRITHSLLGAMLLPMVTIAVLWSQQRSRWRNSPGIFRLMTLQILLADSSHLLMDLLVGVTPLPLFWPLSIEKIRLPFGILPSAGQLWPLSSYVYQNCAIELGVMVPLLYSFFILSQKSLPFQRRTLAVLWLCSGVCMYWASTLSRPKL